MWLKADERRRDERDREREDDARPDPLGERADERARERHGEEEAARPTAENAVRLQPMSATIGFRKTAKT